MKRAKACRTNEELAAYFAARAVLPPEQADSIFVRHLSCKESLALAQNLCRALGHSPRRRDGQTLVLAGELLPPLA